MIGQEAQMIKGFKLVHSTKNFKAFENERRYRNEEEFLNLCEIQLKRGFVYHQTWEDLFIFRRDVLVKKSGTEEKYGN